METPFFFDGHVQLFAVLHQPAGSADKMPFVFCHPFGEEKLWAHRVYVSYARELARRGHPVLRFDYAGNGDSGGDFSDWSLSVALGDIASAIDELKRRTAAASVGLVGLRLGASLAAEVAEARDDIARLALWSPIVNGGRYMQELLRINLTTQMAVYGAVRLDRDGLTEQLRQGHTANVDGYEVSPELHDELSRLSLAGRPRGFQGPCLVTQIERSEQARPSDELQKLAALFPGGVFQLVKEEPFWKETVAFCDAAPNLFKATSEWLDSK